MKPILIIGQGIAGSVLGLSLFQKNIPFEIVNIPKNNSASRLASGLYNPIVLKRMKAVWEASYFMDSVNKFYPWVEDLLKTKFLFQQNIVRLFSSIQEQNDWSLYLNKPVLNSHLKPKTGDNYSPTINSPYGYGIVEGCGWVDTITFLNAASNFFSKLGVLTEDRFEDFSSVFIENKLNTYHKIIFCEGFQIKNNPFFKNLPFSFTKGEVIEIYSNSLQIDDIINAGIFIIPLGEGKYKVGSTYSWDPLDEIPTSRELNNLTNQLKSLVNMPFEVTSHLAGIRPTVRDRKPIVGLLPNNQKIGIFNGLGSRGILMAPGLASNLINHILTGSPLLKGCGLSRFT